VSAKFERAGTIEELKSKRRLILRGAHRPILVVENQGRIFALDNRRPHMGSARPWQHRGRHSDLPLAPRAVRS
jgi:nitrite reductase/ring-hydroxylating ferredoxin subunit